MKTTVFPLENPKLINAQNDFPDAGDDFFNIPILEAYAISSWTLNGEFNGEIMYEKTLSEIVENGFFIEEWLPLCHRSIKTYYECIY